VAVALGFLLLTGFAGSAWGETAVESTLEQIASAKLFCIAALLDSVVPAEESRIGELSDSCISMALDIANVFD
jgi:hypothetical protein